MKSAKAAHFDARTPSREVATRDYIKGVALKLFTDSGFDAVTTRQIAEASGKKNSTLLNYYFGSKDGLIDELIRDIFESLRRDRVHRLNLLLQTGRPTDVDQILEILATPAPADHGMSQTSRFIAMLLLNGRNSLSRWPARELDLGTRRCIHHLRRLLRHLPKDDFRDRIGLIFLLLASSLVVEELSSTGPTETVTYLPSPSRAEVLKAAKAILCRS